MFEELKSLENQIVVLIDKRNELREKIVREKAKFKAGTSFDRPIVINCNEYSGFFISNVTVSGGFVKNRFEDSYRFNEYKICYTVVPEGEHEGYLFYEDELLSRLNMTGDK